MFDTSMSGMLKHFKTSVHVVLTAEFTDAMYPVVKITGGRPNPDVVKHWGARNDAMETLLAQ